MDRRAENVEADVAPDRTTAWLTPVVRGLGTASFLAEVGHEIPTALLPDLLTKTLGAAAWALGLIEGVSDGLAGVARVDGGALAAASRSGYSTTAVLGAATGAATAGWQVGLPRAGAWSACGLRVPARNALLADGRASRKGLPFPCRRTSYGLWTSWRAAKWCAVMT